MKIKLFLFALLYILLICSCSYNPKKVACIGDSITEGYGLKNQGRTSYPIVLDSLLGPSYVVANFGRSATTLQKDGDFPYWITKEFHNIFAFNPDIIILKLGTNDTKPYNWNSKRFELDYQALIDTLETLKTRPVIYLCYPVPVYKTAWGINDSTIINGVIPVVDKMAAINDLKIIDLYNRMKDRSENFPDGIHPDEKGAFEIARIVEGAIK